MQNKQVKNSKNDLRKKRILITGATGFVGSHLVRKLKLLGADVYGIAKDTTVRNIFKINILDVSAIDELIKKLDIEICFHLAGESLVESGKKDPYHTFKVNIEGTLNILESARKHGLEKVIIASTSHVYGHNKLPYYEGYAPRPTRPYETSKACTDLIAQSYASSFNLPVLIPRFVNIYGPGDLHFTRLIPKTIKDVLSNISPKMWGGEAVREYLFIDDAIDAYIKLAKADLISLRNNRVFNFGSGIRISVKDLIKKIIYLSGKHLKIENVDTGRSSEILSQFVSSNKAKKLLAWEPKMALEEGLKRTLSWYAAQKL